MDGQLVQPPSNIRLTSQSLQPLKQLLGFQPHHRIPRSVSEGRNFLANVAKEEFENDLNLIFNALRSEYKLKRKEIVVHGPEGRFGNIETPFFCYEVSIDFFNHEPEKVIWSRSIHNIRKVRQIFDPAFQNVFGQQFTRISFETPYQIQLDSVIDHFEDIDSNQLQLNYDKDCRWCEIELAGSNFVIRIEPEQMLISSRLQEIDPSALFQTLFDIQIRLKDILRSHLHASESNGI